MYVCKWERWEAGQIIDVRFVFWLIPLWTNFRLLLFTCWLILPLIFWPPSFSRTGYLLWKPKINLQTIVKSWGILQYFIAAGVVAGGMVPGCRKKCMKNSSLLPRSVLKRSLQNDILRWKKIPYKAILEPLLLWPRIFFHLRMSFCRLLLNTLLGSGLEFFMHFFLWAMPMSISQARAWDLLRVACSQIRCRPN